VEARGHRPCAGLPPQYLHRRRGRRALSGVAVPEAAVRLWASPGEGHAAGN